MYLLLLMLCFISPSTACSVSLCCCLWCWLFEPCLLRKQGHAWERAPLNVTITIHVFSRHFCQRQPFPSTAFKLKKKRIEQFKRRILGIEFWNRPPDEHLPATPNFKWTPENFDTRPWTLDIFMTRLSTNYCRHSTRLCNELFVLELCNFLPRPDWDDSWCLGPGPKTEIAKWLIIWLILKYHDILF